MAVECVGKAERGGADEVEGAQLGEERAWSRGEVLERMGWMVKEYGYYGEWMRVENIEGWPKQCGVSKTGWGHKNMVGSQKHGGVTKTWRGHKNMAGSQKHGGVTKIGG